MAYLSHLHIKIFEVILHFGFGSETNLSVHERKKQVEIVKGYYL
jgi:hypothetical protein